MTGRPVRIPGTDHPIAIAPTAGRVVVSVGGRVIADSVRALTLTEAAYPPVHYIPREDVDMSLLARTDHASYCAYKGDCAYYSVPIGGEPSVNAVWTYEAAYAAVSPIEGYLAFWPGRVDAIEVRPA